MKQARVSEAKKKKVIELTKIISQHNVIGLADLQNLPAGALASIKKKLRGKAQIIVAKKPLIQRAIQATNKPNINAILENSPTMPALVLGNENPFKIYTAIKKSKTKAAAKTGQTSPYDITVPAGPTPFTPGPVISELSALKIKAGVEEGKIVIKQDATVIKKGEAFSDKLASMLARLGIQPMEIGLNLAAMYEQGKVYGKDVLEIDDETAKSWIAKASQESMNLAIEAKILIKETVQVMIQKAERAAQALKKMA